MKSPIHVANAPEKPTVIFDGDCGFCRRWIAGWRTATGDSVDYFPAQEPEIGRRFPEIPRGAFDASIQLVETNGEVCHGSEAVFRALSRAPEKRWLLGAYERIPLFAKASEACYRFVARHRMFFSFLTRALLPPTPLRFELTRSLFLRALGLVYLAAFLSLGSQILGLVGSQGISPAAEFMRQAEAQVRGMEKLHLVPTFCWFGAGDASLQWQCRAGAALAVLLVCGFAPGPILLVLWLLYLSLTTVCGVFLGFQWENLLLEAGFLAVFFAPWSRTIGRGGKPSLLFAWLLRWLLFRLMFESGLVKLLSGDPAWANLTALDYHYETQPLPTWVAWHAHHLPAGFQKLCVAAMFAIELPIAVLILLPRRCRVASFLPLLLLQGAIAVTGNYCYFNLLTAALCLAVLDDEAILRFAPKRWREAWGKRLEHRSANRRASVWRWIGVPVTCAILAISLLQFCALLRFKPPLAPVAAALYAWEKPLRSVNRYGLFAMMTTTRQEIVVEGSIDGQNWLPYEFKHKPGDLRRRPEFVAPHQPRLDWQMWFAALGSVEENPWFVNFCLSLLQGAEPVLALLKTNPFADKPPKYVRAELYTYHFSDAATRRDTGQWWTRVHDGPYCPPISLKNFGEKSP